MKKAILQTLGGAVILSIFVGIFAFVLFHPWVAGIVVLVLFFGVLAYLIGWVLWGQPPPRI